MPSAEQKQEITQAILDAADSLADFANLKPDDLADFRQRYPNFAPDSWPGGWWNSRVVAEQGGLEFRWQEMQRQLHKLWLQRFSPDLCVELMIVGTEWARMSAKYNAQQQAGEEQELRAGSGFDASPKVWDFQRAIMFLYVQPWRARICEMCGKMYVANHGKRKYCTGTNSAVLDASNTCAAKAVEQQHLEWGRKNNWGRPKKKSKTKVKRAR